MTKKSKNKETPTVCVGTMEKANMIWLYKEVFESIGYKVITVALPHSFYKNEYTYNLSQPQWLHQYIPPNNLFSRIANSIRARFALMHSFLRRNFLFYKLKKEIDILVVIGDSFFEKSHRDLEILHKKGIKIIQVCFGGDVRCWNAFEQEFKVDISSITNNPIDNYNFNIMINRLRKMEIYADAIFSVEDQNGLALRPMHKAYVPFECTDYNFKVTARDVPKVVHIESKLPYKGEPYIYEAIKKLKEEGLEFEFKSYKHIPHEQVIEILEDADILLDECMIFGPGILGNEAIACGCALATKMQQDHYIKDFVCDINFDNIVNPLRQFILNKDVRVKNLEIAYDILKTKCSHKAIALDMLEKLKIDRFDFEAHQYRPSFFLEKYQLPKGHLISESNKISTLKVAQILKLDIAKIANLKSRNLL